ncbi:proline iminopeptidase-family hydrolase [Robertkochia aurantiaca]|uniref:proline iminopeptidase-family hydrolase n=1 Tax=Robertkochia aurantiaca TaxID=2873700 RepID=UPI001CCC389D|nr:proline iminopeptidase-family hydrolase [Robertkochia sp. 3YJGBD-33]
MSKPVHSCALLLLVLSVCLISCRKEPGLIPSEGLVEVEGGQLWYKIIGTGEKDPILVMHGGPGGTHRKYHHLTPLSKDRSVILFDQLGTGRSGYHQDTTLMTVPHFVEQVHRLKEHLNLDEYYLLGHSWGAALELAYYQKYPEGVQGIIFSSPYLSTPVWEADADTLITTLADTIQLAIRRAEEMGAFTTASYQHADSVYWSRFGNRRPGPNHPADTVEAPSNRFMYNYMWGPSEFTATGTLKTYDNVGGLKDVEVPVLFITGEYDEARPATIYNFQKMVPGSDVYVVPESGHSTMIDNTDDYLKGIQEFLERTER